MKYTPLMSKTSVSGEPPKRRKQAERTALSDRLLTEAAIELLVKNGIQGTTLQGVGERAGYSRGLATHRFGSKAGLFAKVLEVASADWLVRMQKAVGPLTGAEAFCAATDAADQFIRERPSEVRAMYLLWFLSIDPGADYRSNLANVHRAQRRDAAEWIRAGQRTGTVDASVDAMRVAEQYCASMAGIIYQWLVNSRMPLTSMFEQLKNDLTSRLHPAAEAKGATQRRTSRARSGRGGNGARSDSAA